MNVEKRSYIPALRFPALTALYDPLIRATLRENEFKSALVQQVGLTPGHRVLDLGAGTGTLTLMLKRAESNAAVVGVDGDPQVLDIARAKASASSADVTFDQGLAYALPYPDGGFDRVVSSLVFHHLTFEDKCRAVREACRVLRPGGEMHVADWGKASNVLMRVLFLGVQILDGFATTADNVAGRLTGLLEAAGFVDVHETRSYATVFGTLALYRATKPLLPQ